MVEDCGGIATFHEAVRVAAQSRGRTTCGVSVSESNLHLHAWLQQMYSAVDSSAAHQTWRLFNLPEYAIDFYGAGFPCQPFSRQGDKHGVGDVRFSFVIAQLDAVLSTLRPKAALLENTEDFQAVFTKKLMPIAKRHGYHCVYAVVNSNLWVPQNRPRFYALLVAPRFIPTGFDLQSLIPRCPQVCAVQVFRDWINSVSHGLTWISIATAKTQFGTSTVFLRNLALVLSTGEGGGLAKVMQSTSRPAYIFCDMGASKCRAACSLDSVPCITLTRGSGRRLWVFKAPTTHATFTACARLDVATLGSLQGWSSSKIKTMAGLLPPRQLCGAFGNGMTLPVLVEIVSQVMTMFANGSVSVQR